MWAVKSELDTNGEWDEAQKSLNMWRLSCHYPPLCLREEFIVNKIIGLSV